MARRKRYTWAGCLAVLALSACGGGSAVSDASTPPPEQSAATPAPNASNDMVYDVSYIDAKLGFAGGNGGWMQSTQDGGATWTQLSAVTGEVVKITFADALHGWVLTTAGLERTSDGGKTWQLVSKDGRTDDGSFKLTALDTNRILWTSRVTSSNRLGGTSYNERASVSEDGGTSWRVVLSGNSVVATATGTHWAAADDGGTLRTSDLGLTLTTGGTLPPCFPVLNVVNEQDLWGYCGGFRNFGPEVASPDMYDRPKVFHSLDGGQTWTDVKASFPPILNLYWSLSNVALNAQGEGWGLLSYGSFESKTVTTLRVSNGGQTWTPLTLPPALTGAVPIVDWIIDPNALWLVLNNQVQWTEDGGASWKVLNMPATESRTPIRIKRVAGGALLAQFVTNVAGELDTHKQRFYHSVDAGKSWQRVPGGVGS